MMALPPVDEARGRRRSVRSKFLRVMLGILVPMLLAILGCVTYLQYRLITNGASQTERTIRESVRTRGRVLTQGHALAMRSMVADNGFSAVSELVQHAVNTDPDLIYGLFLASDDVPWVYVAPDKRGAPVLASDLRKWRELHLLPGDLRATRPLERSVRLFGNDVLEFSAPVYDGKELLGTVRYGFSTRSTSRELAHARLEAERTLFMTLLVLGLLTTFSVLLGILLVTRAARDISLPVRALAEAADRIAQGQRDVRVHVQSGDELELCARAFNHMLEVNQRAFEQLEETTERALEAARVKSEFLANMSHEIRTPMNGVMGIAGLMLQLPLEGRLRRYVETINASSTALLTIINDVLDFSKLESGKYVLQSVSYEPRLVVQEVAELLATRATEKGLEIVYRADPSVPHQLRGDRDRFRQVLHNLVGNAVKFTERGEIFIEFKLERGTKGEPVVRTRVTDTGIGVDEHDQATIFDAFAQVDGSLVRRHGGTGLGLAISKRLAEAMGGSIGVWSREGMGSQFWFDVPGPFDETSVLEPPPLPGGKRALVIESNHRWRDVIVEHMRSWGMDAETFPNLQSGLSRVGTTAENRGFDVLVVGTPVGPRELKALVESVETPRLGKRVPLIFLNYPGATTSVAELEAQVVGQLQKPLRMSDLYNSLQDAFLAQKPFARKPGTSRKPRMLAGRKVLVVDDNHVNQFVAVEQLEEAGYACDVASDGAEAVALTEKNDYLLVLMDCQMPVMDGYTATREIRRREQGTDGHLVIVALTAHALTGERERVLASGMDDYLPKPLRANALERMIARHLRVSAVHEPVNPLSTTCITDSRPDNDTGRRRPVLGPALDPEVTRTRGFVEICLREMPKQRDGIVEAMEAGDLKALRSAAHKLKGAALAACAERLAYVSEKLQDAAEQADLERCVDLTCTLQEYFEEVEVALREELASLAS